MRTLILVTLLCGASGCAATPAARPADVPTGAPAAGMRFIAHRPIQEIQPPSAPATSAPVPCYTLSEKHAAFGGVAFYRPQSEEVQLADASGGVMRRFTVPEPIAGSCGEPRGLKVVQLKAVIYWAPKTCAHLVRGAILALWEQQGAHKGQLGFPITDELPLAEGGLHQYFENGEITWTPIEGARLKRRPGSSSPGTER